jgi:hypothetical protein
MFDFTTLKTRTATRIRMKFSAELFYPNLNLLGVHYAAKKESLTSSHASLAFSI